MTAAASRALARLRWANPGGALLVLAGIAWLALVSHSVALGSASAAHRMTPELELGHWALMVIAMMFPLLHDPLRAIRHRSFDEWRSFMVASFLIAYLGVWTLVGVPVVILRMQEWSSSPVIPPFAFMAAAGWGFTKACESGRRECHRKTGLAAGGWAGARDAIAYGARLGSACVLTCWPLMVACTLTGHAWVAMLAALAIGASERLAFRPSTLRTAAMILGLSVWYGGVALVSAEPESQGDAHAPHCAH